jgi:hypothetical protein
VEKFKLYDRGRIEWSAILASILSAEIGLLQLDELCTHVLSRKLASGKVERDAYTRMR